MREFRPDAWERFTRMYGILVYGWCRRAGLQEHDAADLTQEVFRAVVERIRDFRRDRQGDSFRGWLWGITRHKLQDHYRRATTQPIAQGGSTAQQLMVEVPESQWDSIADLASPNTKQLLLHQALAIVKDEFEERTWQAFWRLTVEEQRPESVASDLQMTVGAVYTAKSRVMKRVREEFDELL